MTERERFDKNFQICKEQILQRDTAFREWMYQHFAEIDGHYYGDECYEEFVAFENRTIEVCKYCEIKGPILVD